ncbi:MAG: cytochrome C oxidase subunit IV family protein [Labilithrix sp.]|nr:cytochrome C oxidase subunit IV family protein [Labilithrix sp.]MCW5815681.1 cytochrome C oxidase subunit IV family protein [Labilithrix sp.]
MTSSIARTALALGVLWAVSLALSYVDLGRAALPIALVIAAVKAALVGAVFMELTRARASIRLAVAAAGALAAILVGLVIADVELREPAPLVVPGR